MPRLPPMARSRRNPWLPSQQQQPRVPPQPVPQVPQRPVLDLPVPNEEPAPEEEQQPRVPDQPAAPRPRLVPVPDEEHVPEGYSDVVEYSVPPLMFQAMERHLPPALISAPRADKLRYMRGILYKYVLSPREIIGKEKLGQYRARIASSYQPLYPELYTLNPSAFFLPSFIDAIRTNTIESFSSIIEEVAPALYSFPMLQPAFCNKLITEVIHFRNWANLTNEVMMDPTSFDRPGQGIVLCDIGMQGMMDDVMKQFVIPISTVLFPEFGGGSLDSQHSFVVLYGGGDGIGMHVEDCDITLSVCLGGDDFNGGEMLFCGRHCVNHVNSETYEQEQVLYPQAPGRALLHLGRHRHHLLPTYGFRANMTMWCKSSAFKEAMKYRTYFPDWCGKCRLRE